MSRFTMDFQCDNAAFNWEGRFDKTEVATIIQSVANRVRAGITGGVLHDSNGNKVGSWSLDIDEEDDDAN